MSKNYDNWERLVGAVLKKEEFRKLALRQSTSFSTISDDASWLGDDSQEFQTLPDTVWDGVFPADLLEIVSRSVSPVVYSDAIELYLSLCNSQILIDDGKLSFSLEKRNGKKCYMVGARELGIIWCGNTPQYWDLKSHPDSRFSEVALLKDVCWLEIRGTINTRMLSSGTVYGCYLVFKLDRNPYGLQSANAFVRFRNDGDNERAAILDHFERENARDRRRGSGKVPVRIGDGLTEISEVHLQLPDGRGDGWMEEELGSDQGYDSGGDGRQDHLDPFRRENARPPVISDRSGRQNLWGQIYRPWGRRQPHPHPSPPVRMQDNGSQEPENRRVALRIGDGLTEITEVHLQRPTGNSESSGKQNSWGKNYQPHGRRRPSPPPVRIGDGFTKKDEMQLQRPDGSEQTGRVAVRRGDGWMEVELGSFYNDRGDDGVVDTWLLGKDGSQWKSGLIVQGIEFRPIS